MNSKFWGISFFIFLPICLVAVEGKSPIHQPTTITAPGHYLVTRDFSASSQSAINIQTDHVELDLGGHTLTMLTSSNGIHIEDGYTDITIRNGTIVNSSVGIHFLTASTNTIRIVIEDVTILDPAIRGIQLDYTEYAEIRGCRIEASSVIDDSGISVAAQDGLTFAGSICDNVVINTENHGIKLRGLTNGFVMNNQVSRFGQVETVSYGIYVESLGDAKSNVISGNTIDGDDVCVGFAGIALIRCNGSMIRGNTVSKIGSAGIFVYEAPGSIVLENVVHGCGEYGIHVSSEGVTLRGNTSAENTGDGIFVMPFDSVIVDGNSCTHNDGWGLNIDNGIATTPYRNNLLVANTTGAVNGGVDEGGNIL